MGLQDTEGTTGRVVDARVRALRPEFGPELGGLAARVLSAARGKPGEVAGRYAPGAVLGAGASGVVYVARDKQLERNVALKIVKARGEAEVQRVLREARALALVSDPHVVEIFEVGLTHGSPYLVMELVQGDTLRQWLARGQHPWREVVTMVLQAAQGLAAAHRKGVIHRDFKPDNALLGADGRVRIADFGLACVALAHDTTEAKTTADPASSASSDASLTLTPAGLALGTPAYMAPEAFEGVANEASDQYSLGVVLYEGLVGSRPSQGATSAEELRRHQRRADVRVPRTAAVPRRLAAAVERSLRRDPAQRFADLERFIAALQASTAPRRVRGWMSVVGLGLGVGLVGVGWAGVGDAAQPCAHGQTPWTALANQTHRLDAIARPLTEYAERWQQVEAGLCDTNTAALSDAQRRCLDQCVSEARALVGLVPELAYTDHAAIVKALRALPDPKRCVEPDGDAFVPPPDGMGPMVASIQADLARARALRMTAQIGAALEQSTDVLAAARAAGFAPLHADAATEQGRLLSISAEHEAAKQAYEEAYFVARDASLGWFAGGAASSLVMVVGSQLGDVQGAQRWAEHARTAYERAGFDPLRQIGYVQGMARLAHREGDMPGVEKFARIGIGIQDANGKTDTEQRAAMLTLLGIAQVAQGEHEAAIASFEAAGDIYAKTHGEASIPGSKMLDNAGYALRELGRTDEALEKHLAALAMGQAAFPELVVERAYSHGNIALVYAELGRLDEALEHASISVESMSAKLGSQHRDAGEAYRIRGLIRAKMGAAQHALALADYERALAIWEEIEPESVAALQVELAAVRDAGAAGR